jgi:hypothetical protein
MTKMEAAAMFGGTYADLARALELKRAAISRWPAELTQTQCDRVVGAALRLRKPIPPQFRKRTRRTHNIPANGNGSS